MKLENETPTEMFWSMLALLGCLILTGILALGVRLTIGKW